MNYSIFEKETCEDNFRKIGSASGSSGPEAIAKFTGKTVRLAGAAW